MSAQLQDAVTLCKSLSRMELSLTVHITRVAADEAYREFDRLRRVGTTEEYEAAQRVLDDVRARLAELERQVQAFAAQDALAVKLDLERGAAE